LRRRLGLARLWSDVAKPPVTSIRNLAEAYFGETWRQECNFLNLASHRSPQRTNPRGQIFNQDGCMSISALSPAQIALLPAATISGLTTTDLTALSSTQVAAINTSGIAALTTTETQALGSTQVKALTTTQIAGLSTTAANNPTDAS